MSNLLYELRLLWSKLQEYFSYEKYLHTARKTLLHEIDEISVFTHWMTRKIPAIYLGVAKYGRVLCVRPRTLQKELGHVLFLGKTRIGKGLAIETNSFTWPYPYIANDIKRELWNRTAAFREKGLGGKSCIFNPEKGEGRFDPLEGKDTDFELQSAAHTLLYRGNEGKNQIFTDTAITMLQQIFIAARLERQRPLPFTYKIINEGFFGAATILKIITERYNYYPNLVVKFLDSDYDKANFNSEFLKNCWSTLTRRLSRILTKESVRCFMGSDFTPKDIITSGKNPISVYLCWPEQHIDTLAPLIQLVWNSLLMGMVGHYDATRGKGCARVLAVLDEIFRTGLPELPKHATTFAGRNISLLVSGQSVSQLYAAYGQYEAEVLLEQFDHIVEYRPAPAANRTAQFYEESAGYTSGFAQSKTDYEHGSSEGESEQRIPIIPGYTTKRVKRTKVIVQADGYYPTDATRLDWHDFPELVARSEMKLPVPPIVPQAYHPAHSSQELRNTIYANSLRS